MMDPHTPQPETPGEEDPILALVAGILAEAGIEEAPRDVVRDAILEQSQRIARRLLQSVNKERHTTLEEHARIRGKFERRLHRLWGTALEKLELLIVCSENAGEGFNERWRPVAVRDQDFVFEVLVRLHARALQTAREVLTLLKSGYAAGAHARWRTLHEIAVVGFFIAKQGNETAERYLLHEGVESHKGMVQYQRHHGDLRMEALTASEVEAVVRRKEDLVQRFGKDFTSEYGWASLPNNTRPKFVHIEAAAGLTHFRPWYQLSNYSVHAGSKGLQFNLGLWSQKETLLTGVSNGGLADPGHSTAISLAQITTALLGRQAWIQDITTIQMLLLLVDDIGEVFLRAHRRWEKKAGVEREP
jgi:hypothetical protein